MFAGYSNVLRGMDVNNTNFSTEAHTTNSAVWPVPFMRIAISPGHSRSDPFSLPDHVPSSILGDPGEVSRAGRKGATKVVKHRWKSPWVPTLTGPLAVPNGQANAGSWLGTKIALYYGAQSANSISWVSFNFVSSYTTAFYSITACLEMHAVRKLKLLISKYCLPEN